MQPSRIISQVQPDGTEPERLHLSEHWPHKGVRQVRALRIIQARHQDPQIAGQLVGGGISFGTASGVSRFGVAQCPFEPRHHAGQVLPEDLARVTDRYVLAVLDTRQCLLQRRAERGRYHDRPFGDAQDFHQLGESGVVSLQAGAAILGERAASDVIGDERIPSRSPPIQEPNCRKGGISKRWPG